MEAIEKIDFEKVGKRMKKLRKEQRISQDQVAKDLGATISFVSNIENNYTKINLRVLLYYAQMCHVSVDYLLSAGNPRMIKADNISTLDEDILRVLQNYNKLDIENPIIRINTAFKGCSSLEKISVLPRIYHN